MSRNEAEHVTSEACPALASATYVTIGTVYFSQTLTPFYFSDVPALFMTRFTESVFDAVEIIYTKIRLGLTCQSSEQFISIQVLQKTT